MGVGPDNGCSASEDSKSRYSPFLISPETCAAFIPTQLILSRLLLSLNHSCAEKHLHKYYFSICTQIEEGAAAATTADTSIVLLCRD